MFHCENAPDADAAAGRFHWSDIMLTPPVSPPKSKLQHEASTPGFGICVSMSCGTEDIGSEISLSLSPDSPSLVLVDEGKDKIIAALRARCGALEDEVLQLRERLAEHSVGLMDSLDLDRSSRLSKSCDDEEGEESTDNSNSAGPLCGKPERLLEAAGNLQNSIQMKTAKSKASRQGETLSKMRTANGQCARAHCVRTARALNDQYVAGSQNELLGSPNKASRSRLRRSQSDFFSSPRESSEKLFLRSPSSGSLTTDSVCGLKMRRTQSGPSLPIPQCSSDVQSATLESLASRAALVLGSTGTEGTVKGCEIGIAKGTVARLTARYDTPPSRRSSRSGRLSPLMEEVPERLTSTL